MGQITLQRVRKSFGPVNIIKDANLDIDDGSFVDIRSEEHTSELQSR